MNSISDTAPLEWRGPRAYIGDHFVGACYKAYGPGVWLGVWDGQNGRMHWAQPGDDVTQDDMLEDMRARGILEVIPDHATRSL